MTGFSLTGPQIRKNQSEQEKQWVCEKKYIRECENEQGYVLLEVQEKQIVTARSDTWQTTHRITDQKVLHRSFSMNETGEMSKVERVVSVYKHQTKITERCPRHRG